MSTSLSQASLTVQARILVGLATSLALTLLSAAAVPEIVAHRDLAYASMPGVAPKLLSLDVFTDQHLHGAPVLVYVHGGAWVGGDKSGGLLDVREQMSSFFLGSGFVFVTVNYRLAPAARHPAQAQDVARALAWVENRIAGYGGAPGRIFVCGHSAGAHLASLVSTDPRYLGEVGKTNTLVKGVISLDTGAHDLVPTAQFPSASLSRRPNVFELTFGRDPQTLRDASPLHQVAPGKGIPPHMLVFAADMPPASLGKPARETSMATALRAAGIRAEIYDASFHTHYTLMADLGSPGDPVAPAILQFIQSALNPGPPMLGSSHVLKPDSQAARRQQDIAERSVRRLLSLLDGDKDGTITRAEAESSPGGWARYFPEFDKDRDGSITLEEQCSSK